MDGECEGGYGSWVDGREEEVGFELQADIWWF